MSGASVASFPVLHHTAIVILCVIGTVSDNSCGRGLGMRLARVSVSAVGMHSPMVG